MGSSAPPSGNVNVVKCENEADAPRCLLFPFPKNFLPVGSCEGDRRTRLLVLPEIVSTVLEMVS